MTDWSALSTTLVFTPTLMLVIVFPHWTSAFWCSTGIQTVLRLRTPSYSVILRLMTHKHLEHKVTTVHRLMVRDIFATIKTNQWHRISGIIVNAELNKTNTNRIMVSAACINTVLSCLLLVGLFCFLKQRDLVTEGY